MRACVSTPSAQPASRHLVVDPTKPAQVARVTPSHTFSLHGAPAVAASHAVRLPSGLPMTGTHTPKLPGTVHASHWPVHLLSQHTPSVQRPVPHSVSALHGAPWASTQSFFGSLPG